MNANDESDEAAKREGRIGRHTSSCGDDRGERGTTASEQSQSDGQARRRRDWVRATNERRAQTEGTPHSSWNDERRATSHRDGTTRETATDGTDKAERGRGDEDEDEDDGLAPGSLRASTEQRTGTEGNERIEKQRDGAGNGREPVETRRSERAGAGDGEVS